MNLYNLYGPKCKGGCGTTVENRTGYCRKCRAAKCTKCGKNFTSHDISPEKICTTCKSKKANSSRTKSYNNVSGVFTE
jgi:DNA-directed RNA polymerase subunit RPC12/RpoP